MVSLMKRRTVIFCFECYTATYLQNVGKKEEVLVIKLQFVVVSVLFQPQLCKVTQRFFPQKSRESKNVIHSNVCVTISNPEVDISSNQKKEILILFIQVSMNYAGVHTVQKIMVIGNKRPRTFDSFFSLYVIYSYIKSLK